MFLMGLKNLLLLKFRMESFWKNTKKYETRVFKSSFKTYFHTVAVYKKKLYISNTPKEINTTLPHTFRYTFPQKQQHIYLCKCTGVQLLLQYYLYEVDAFLVESNAEN